MTMIAQAQRRTIRRGEATLVADITQARGLNDGKGYTRDYVVQVLNELRNNEAIEAIYQEVLALRSPKPTRRRK